MDVGFEGKNGHDAGVTRCLLLTQSGHSHTSEPNTFELGSDSLTRLAGLYECRPSAW
jgi:hypothetical protein